jgi:hypothetical protein
VWHAYRPRSGRETYLRDTLIVSASINGGDLAIWTAVIAGGSAVIAGIVATVGGAWATSRTLRANSRLARDQFLREKQAEAYVMVANHVARVRAWANIAVDEAKGNPPRFLAKPELWTGDEWYQMSAQLRVFGSFIARVQFDQMHNASSALHLFVKRYENGNPATPEEVDAAFQLVHLMASRLTIVFTAELGPLNDELKDSPKRWWQVREKRTQQRKSEARNRLINGSEDDEQLSDS